MNRRQNNEPDIIVAMMQFISKLADGGHSIIYTGAGVFIFVLCAFFAILKWEVPNLSLAIGLGLCLVGMLFFFLTRQK